ncbi:MAG: hypothetical protein ACRCXE_03260 [Metamycoplasmataceae bacterium]
MKINRGEIEKRITEIVKELEEFNNDPIFKKYPDLKTYGFNKDFYLREELFKLLRKLKNEN